MGCKYVPEELKHAARKEMGAASESDLKALEDKVNNGGSGSGTASTMTGSTAEADGAAGLVPAPKAGEQDKFLRGDGTWAAVIAEGGLTSAQISALDGLFKIAAYTEDASTAYSAFKVAFGIEESGGGETETTYTVTNNLTNVTNGNSDSKVSSGNAYVATLTAVDGYEMDSVTITMGGADRTGSAYDGNGGINISSVTGDIVITAVATVVVENYLSYEIGSLSGTDGSETTLTHIARTNFFDVSSNTISCPSGYCFALRIYDAQKQYLGYITPINAGAPNEMANLGWYFGNNINMSAILETYSSAAYLRLIVAHFDESSVAKLNTDFTSGEMDGLTLIVDDTEYVLKVA